MKIIVVVLALSLSSAFAQAKIETQGHRGARGSRPENTLPAFEFAIANGVDTLELDLAVSSDEQLVISHEPAITPERCLDPSGNKLKEAIYIRSLKYDEIKKYDCGSLGHERFSKQVAVPHTPMPRLEDLFEMVEKSTLPQAKKVHFNIETKIYPSKPELTPEPEEFARKIILLGRKHNMISRMILQSFDDRTLIASKKIEPKLLTSMLTSDNHVDYVAVAKSAHADIISPDYTWILESDVKALHKAHVKVLPWTVNDQKDWDHLVDIGVDGIISDYPKELVEHLKAR